MWKDISSKELLAFLALCIVSGILRTRKEPVARLWKTNAAYATPIIRAIMVRDRFFQILHVICFNDKTTRNQWRSTDKLAPITNVLECIII